MVVLVIVGGSVLLFTPLPHHHRGFLNSDAYAGVGSVCLRIPNPPSKPLDEERTAGVWVEMSAADPSVTASRFVVVGGVFSLARSLPPLPIPSFCGEIRFMASRGEKLLMGSALVYLALPLPVRRWGRGGGGVTLARMWITVVTDTVVVS